MFLLLAVFAASALIPDPAAWAQNATGEMGSCRLQAINWLRFYNKTDGDVLIKFKDIYFYEE